MKKYRVTYTALTWAEVEVKALSEEDALMEAAVVNIDDQLSRNTTFDFKPDVELIEE